MSSDGYVFGHTSNMALEMTVQVDQLVGPPFWSRLKFQQILHGLPCGLVQILKVLTE